jgi:hypothetical protein
MDHCSAATSTAKIPKTCQNENPSSVSFADEENSVVNGSPADPSVFVNPCIKIVRIARSARRTASSPRSQERLVARRSLSCDRQVRIDENYRIKAGVAILDLEAEIRHRRKQPNGGLEACRYPILQPAVLTALPPLQSHLRRTCARVHQLEL